MDISSACSSCNESNSSLEYRCAPCGHCYCNPCIERMALLALKDRALIPVHCCRKELPIEYVNQALTQAEQKRKDTEIPDESFLAKYHRLIDEKDWQSYNLASDEEYVASISLFQYKQCPGCGIGIERDWGCVHMTCPNGHEFCYTCLSIWGQCNCPLIPEQEIDLILGD